MGRAAVPPLVVAAAVVDDLTDPRWLLAARRSRPADEAGWWELPGGKVEPGEAPQDAVHRELFEELGVRLRLGPQVPGPHDGYWPVGGGYLMQVWWAELSGGHPVPGDDHDDVRLLPCGDWLSVRWLPGDVPVVSALQAHTIQAGPVTG
ncbi:MAG: NUDIX domain-containing protein [Micrococcales bacterium]|nr:NUDIX domain-containing protein [Micrococcales bacterium]